MFSETDKCIDFEERSDGDLVVPIYTPFGGVTIWLDGEPMTGRVEHLESDGDYDPRFPVDGNVRAWFDYEADGKPHTLECKVRPLFPGETTPASGERLEGFEIYDNETMLFIGVEYDSECKPGFGAWHYDYTAEPIEYGVKVDIASDTHTQAFVFGISWVNYTSKETMANPWFVGDPFGDRNVNFE